MQEHSIHFMSGVETQVVLDFLNHEAQDGTIEDLT